MPDDVQDRILALKAEADGAYRAKDALKARDLYYQALDLGELPTIRSNLAAAEFELGQYESSIENSKRVIKFIDEAPDEPNLALRTKNVLRLCRSLTLLKKISEALEIASDLVLQLSSSGSDEQKNSASSVLESLNRATRYPAVSQTDAQTRLMPLPNLRPALNHNMEFYTVGQDKPESLLGCPRVTQLTEEAIHDYIRLRLEIPRDAVAGDTNWDFDAMMIGAGDARHLYSSLIDIATQFSTGTNTLGSEMEDRPKDKGVGIHITVVDIHPYSIARNLVVMYALEELSQFDQSQRMSEPRALDLLTMLHFVFWSCALPPKIHAIVVDIIHNIHEGLQIPWLILEAQTWSKVKLCLEYWLEGSLRLNTVRSMTDPIRISTPTENVERLRAMGTRLPPDFEALAAQQEIVNNELVPPGSRRERIAYRTLKVVWPPERLFDEESPAMREFLLAECAQGIDTENPPSKAQMRAARAAVTETWMPNVTFTARGWMYPDYNHDPYKDINAFFDAPYAIDLAPSHPSATIHDFSCAFFSHAAEGIRSLRLRARRFKIELFAEEGFAVVNKIRFGGVVSRQDSPTLYDRIHLSNVPDYTGGALTTFTAFNNLLKPHTKAFLTFTCLLNTGSWADGLMEGAEKDSLEAYLYGYTGAFLDELEAVFGLRRELPYDMLSHYLVFTKIPRVLPNQLIPRERLTHILYDVFFKTVMPVRWTHPGTTSIREPLNLNAFFRFIATLAETGYPYHWLSETIEYMLSGRILTNARPATRNPVPVPAGHRFTTRETTLYLDSFLSELQVMASIWAPLLPFSINHPRILLPSDICTCQIKVPRTLFGWAANTASALCLKVGKDSQSLLRGTPLNLQDLSACAAVSFFSTIDLAHDNGITTFFIPRRELAKLQDEGRVVALWSFLDSDEKSEPISATSIQVVGDIDNWAAAVASAHRYRAF